jgi:hypothetical protein
VVEQATFNRWVEGSTPSVGILNDKNGLWGGSVLRDKPFFSLFFQHNIASISLAANKNDVMTCLCPLLLTEMVRELIIAAKPLLKTFRK